MKKILIAITAFTLFLLGPVSASYKALTAGTDYAKPSQSNTIANILASSCGSTENGQLGFPTDATMYQLNCTGSAWAARAGGDPVTIPPTSGWSQPNGGTLVHTGFVSLTAAASATDNIRSYVRSQPSKPYTITARVQVTAVQENFFMAGLAWRDSSSGKIAACSLGYSSGAKISSVKYTNNTTYSALYKEASADVHGAVMIRIADNNTSRICSFSNDGGKSFTALHTVGNTDFLTADQVAIAANSTNASYGPTITITSWLPE